MEVRPLYKKLLNPKTLLLGALFATIWLEPSANGATPQQLGLSSEWLGQGVCRITALADSSLGSPVSSYLQLEAGDSQFIGVDNTGKEVVFADIPTFFPKNQLVRAFVGFTYNQDGQPVDQTFSAAFNPDTCMPAQRVSLPLIIQAK